MNSKSPGTPEPDENLMAGQRPLPWEPEIEHSLERLVLRSPSAELDAKVWRILTRPRVGSRLRTTFLAIAAAVAIAAGSVPLLVHYLDPGSVISVADNRTPSQAHATTAPRPLRVERQIARVSDDGVIGTANGVPVQLYRYRALRQVWYFDPRTGKKLQVTVPQNEWVLVPVRIF